MRGGPLAAATYHHLDAAIVQIAALAAVLAEEAAVGVAVTRERAHGGIAFVDAARVFPAVVVAIAAGRAESAWPVRARSQARLIAVGIEIAARAERARHRRALACREREHHERDSHARTVSHA